MTIRVSMHARASVVHAAVINVDNIYWIFFLIVSLSHDQIKSVI